MDKYIIIKLVKISEGDAMMVFVVSRRYVISPRSALQNSALNPYHFFARFPNPSTFVIL